jgi:hypothetical protein
LIFKNQSLSNSKEYGGHFSRCIEQSGGSAIKLVELIVKSFPAYRDEAIYDE